MKSAIARLIYSGSSSARAKARISGNEVTITANTITGIAPRFSNDLTREIRSVGPFNEGAENLDQEQLRCHVQSQGEDRTRRGLSAPKAPVLESCGHHTALTFAVSAPHRPRGSPIPQEPWEPRVWEAGRGLRGAGPAGPPAGMLDGGGGAVGAGAHL